MVEVRRRAYSVEPTNASPHTSATPFRTFVVKLHSRCNLACSYCYLYEGPDASWRGRPRVISRAVIDQTATRIGEHARRHELTDVHVVLHGGEPLLAGAELIAHAAAAIRCALPFGTEARVGMQTNGTLLSEPVLRMLLQQRISVGVSIDGDRAAHDRHRRRPDGGGSHDDVVRAVRLLMRPPFREIYGGLLTTVDIANDPVRTYDALAELRPPFVDFLLPHANWSAPPPGHGSTRYGDWLVAVYERWSTGVEQPRVRLFEEVIRLALGAPGRTEMLGLSPVDIVVVETDGSIEQVDTLKSAFDGAARTGLDVTNHSFDDALGHPGVAVRQGGLGALCDTCRRCPVRDICGGGYFPHRYRDGSFAHPSVYCADLQRLIGHVVDGLRRSLGAVVDR